MSVYAHHVGLGWVLVTLPEYTAHCLAWDVSALEILYRRADFGHQHSGPPANTGYCVKVRFLQEKCRCSSPIPAFSRPCIVAPTSDTGGSGCPAGGVLAAEAAASSAGSTGCRESIFVISVTVLRNGER